MFSMFIGLAFVQNHELQHGKHTHAYITASVYLLTSDMKILKFMSVHRVTLATAPYAKQVQVSNLLVPVALLLKQTNMHFFHKDMHYY